MARRKKKRNKPTDLASMESSARKLQSILNKPEIWGSMHSGVFKGVREKILKIDYATIRNVVDRVPLISAIINTRVEQIKQFSLYRPDHSNMGFEFYLADPMKTPTKKDQDMFFKLANFLEITGVHYDADREDDFTDYLEMITRETLTIDQIATEVQRNRKGEPVAFWALDGATIKRVNPKEFNSEQHEYGKRIGPDHRFIQIVDDKIWNAYTHEDLIFDYKQKRADIRYRGFGYSPVEQAIDMITTLLFGYNYLRDQLMRDRVPKGFIQVMGDVGREQLDSIREYWYSAMSGAGGQWNIPIVPSGKDGIGIDWKNISNSNRDMEYHKMMMFVSTIIAAVFSIDLAEMGIKTDDSQALIGETAEPRIQASKDRGLKGLLSFEEQHINKIIRKVNKNYRFRFIGLEREDETKLADLRKKDVETYRTINEIREENGLEPLEDDYASVVLNPQAVQIYNQTAMAEQGGDMGGGGFGDEGDFDDEEAGAEEEPQGADVDWESMFKSMGESEDKTIHVTIK